MLRFTVEKDVLRQGILLGAQRVDLPLRLTGGGWAGLVVTVGDHATLLDTGLVGRHVWTSEPVSFDAANLAVGDFEERLPKAPDGLANVAVVRAYELPVTQGRPTFLFVEVQVGLSPEVVGTDAEQPARHRALGFVAQGGHGFSLTVPGPFDRYVRGLADGNAMKRFTGSDDGDALMAAGHFVPVWGVHQWDYRLVFCRGALPIEQRALLGRLVLAARRYPLDLGDEGRLDVLACVPELQDTGKGLTRFDVPLWPGRYCAAVSGYTTGEYGVGLIPTYLIELEPQNDAAPDKPLNGESLPHLFESSALHHGD